MHTIRTRSHGAGAGIVGGASINQSVTNLFPKQGKPQCIPPITLGFSFKSLFYNKLDCALSLQKLIGTVVALCLPS
jgi:hypothetical protein